jgi:lysophospholipase L1-like esterase
VLGIGDRWVRADGSISSAIMPDFLHLSPEGYSQWAQALKPEIEAALK